MHEALIAKRIIEEAESKGRVKSAVVEVGDLAALPADELEETMKKMVSWAVIVQRKKAKVKCVCGYEGEPMIMSRGHHDALFKCPECGVVPAVVDGKDIVIKEVEVY